MGGWMRDGRKGGKKEGTDKQMDPLPPSKSKPPSFLTGTNTTVTYCLVSFILALNSPFYLEHPGIF